MYFVVNFDVHLLGYWEYTHTYTYTHILQLIYISVMKTNLYEYYTYTENSFIVLKPSHFRGYFQALLVCNTIPKKKTIWNNLSKSKYYTITASIILDT